MRDAAAGKSRRTRRRARRRRRRKSRCRRGSPLRDPYRPICNGACTMRNGAFDALCDNHLPMMVTERTATSRPTPRGRRGVDSGQGRMARGRRPCSTVTRRIFPITLAVLTGSRHRTAHGHARASGASARLRRRLLHGDRRRRRSRPPSPSSGPSGPRASGARGCRRGKRGAAVICGETRLPAQPIALRSTRRPTIRWRDVSERNDFDRCSRCLATCVHQSAPRRTGIGGQGSPLAASFCERRARHQEHLQVTKRWLRQPCRPFFCVQRAAGSTLRWSAPRSLAGRRRSPRLRTFIRRLHLTQADYDSWA